MGRTRVLLSEASSLTAREFMTVLGRGGVEVEAVTAASMPIAKFSRWCSALYRAPAPSVEPVGYLRAVDALMASGRFDALLPTHEQAWLFAVGRDYLPHAAVAVATPEAFDQVESKVAFAGVLEATGLPQPQWRRVECEDDLDALGFPVWVKASFSTAGRGVRHAHDHQEALSAWMELTASGIGDVMVQKSARGTYAQVQGLFDRGRLIAAAVSEQLAVGAGGSAAARLSVDHPHAVDALARLGEHLNWHGGIDLDYFHQDGEPQFIECNPRTVEPGNAAAAGVDLPRLSIALASGCEPLPDLPVITKAGVRTRSTMAIALGAAESQGTRRAIASAIARAVSRRPPLQTSTEVLTPVLSDPPSVIPFLVATSAVLFRPASVARLAGDTVSTYGVTLDAIQRLRGKQSN
jgi:hypothetical protein